MDSESESQTATATLDRRPVLELADGTRLVAGEREPARLDGDRDHAFTLADVRRSADEAAQPFPGYQRLGA